MFVFRTFNADMLSISWQLHLVGISHKSAPIEVREEFYVDKARTYLLLRKLNTLGITEALVLSTCNRTEIYYHSSAADHTPERILSVLFDTMDAKNPNPDHFYHQTEGNLQYLFRVALGIEAQVTGDQQIIHQCKEAYALSSAESMAGPHLHRLLHNIFYTSKRVATETAWRTGISSVPYVAAQLIKQLCNKNTPANVLIVGTGEVGQHVLQYLSKTPSIQLTLCNRTMERATTLQNQYNCAVIAYETLFDALPQYDVLITCIEQGGQHTAPLIQPQHITNSNPLLCIDLSVPRAIAPSVADLSHVLLYNIDEMQQQTEEALQHRQQALPEVEAIMAEQIAAFSVWEEEMSYSPLIQQLKDMLESLRQQELAQHSKKLNSDVYAQVEDITKGLIQRIMKNPILHIKGACKRGEVDKLAQALVDLFDLKQNVDNAPMA